MGVVGVGRVGAALAVALRRAGHSITAVSGISDRSRRSADRLGVPVRPAEEIPETVDLVLIAVPDDVLPAVVERLAFRPGQLVAHTSGRHGLAVLEPAARQGALPLVIHPVMTFAGAPEDADRLAGASFGVTAPDGELRAVAEALVVEMGGEPVYVAEEHRALYHAALAWGANYTVTLVSAARDLLEQAGVEQPERMLGPLLGAALDNALRRGDAALTGPVARGDAGTVAAHLAALEGTGLRDAYVALARLTADRALQSGRLEATDAEALLGVLGR